MVRSYEKEVGREAMQLGPLDSTGSGTLCKAMEGQQLELCEAGDNEELSEDCRKVVGHRQCMAVASQQELQSFRLCC